MNVTGNYSRKILSAVIVLYFLLYATVCFCAQFYSNSHGYQIDLPHGWVEIPEDVLRENLANLLKPDAKASPIYDAGFQLDSADQWFEYPYIIIQLLPYEKFGLHRQINEDEFSGFVHDLTGVNISKLLVENSSNSVRDLLGNIETGQPQIDMSNHRFLWIMDNNVRGVGPTRGLAVGYFGRELLVQVMFYCRLSDWDRYSRVYSTIVDSFRFDPQAAYNLEAPVANSLQQSIWYSILEKGIVATVLGGIIALIIGFIKVLKRKKPNT
ncbi:MAG: hypothetical protein U9N73_11900 [Candidatus Auribacterota bacterium]|nr:hypothetical protein [Candidatus Auribacterota bacterium]